MCRSRRFTCVAGLPGGAPVVALVVAVVAVGLAGCSQPSSGDEAVEPVQTVAGASVEQLGDGSSFLVAPPSNGNRMTAIVAGRLMLIGGECVGLEGRAAGESTVLVLPHGTRASGDGREIALPDGLRIAVGDEITGGGGYTTLAENPDALDGWPDAPPGCARATSLAGIYDVELT